VGSIRRKQKNPVDIDIVVIPKDKEKVERVLSEKGKLVRHGEKVISYMIEGIKVEVYFTDSDSWGATVMSYTGPSGSSIGLRMIAKKKRLKLNQYGLFKGKKKIVGDTEKGIYKKLGKSWKPPEKR